MSSNSAMLEALTCKNCRRYQYACECDVFISLNPEAYKYFYEGCDECGMNTCSGCSPASEKVILDNEIDPIFNLTKE